MYHKDKKMADGCKSVDKSKERMDAARCPGGVLENRCGNDLSDFVNFQIHVIGGKNSRVPRKMGRQFCASGANLPDIASKPLRQRIHKLLVLRSCSRWWRRNYRNLFPRGLLGSDLVHLTVLRLLTPMIYVVRLPTQIGVCRIDVTAGNGTIDEIPEWSGSDRPDRAGA